MTKYFKMEGVVTFDPHCCGLDDEEQGLADYIKDNCCCVSDSNLRVREATTEEAREAGFGLSREDLLQQVRQGLLTASTAEAMRELAAKLESAACLADNDGGD